MAKYLFRGSFSEEGLERLLEVGGSGYRDRAVEILTSFGGKVDACYFAFGERDMYVIVDLPENVSAVAASILVNNRGKLKGEGVVLLTPEEVDQAVKKISEIR